MESSKNVLSISVENPMVIPLSLSSVMYTQYIPVFILLFFRFDDDTKLDDGVKLKKEGFRGCAIFGKKRLIFARDSKSDRYK